MDQDRLMDINQKIIRLSIIGATLLVTTSSVPALQGDASFKEDIKKQISVSLQDVPIDDEK